MSIVTSQSEIGSNEAFPKLFDRRIVFVLGKGGVGRTTVAAAIAQVAQSHALAPCLVEMNGAESLGTLFGGGPVGYEGRELRPGLWAQSIRADQAVEEYLVRSLKLRSLYEAVFKNRFVEPFMNGVMGLSDLISVGKIMDLEWLRSDGSYGPEAKGPFRHGPILVDGPATGHALSMLGSPKAMMDITRSGPLFRNAEAIQSLFSDANKVAILIVTRPEELPVNEALEAADRLKSLGLPTAGVVLNGMPEPVLPKRAEPLLDKLGAAAIASNPSMRWAVSQLNRQQNRWEEAEGQANRLLSATDLPVLKLPLLPNGIPGPESLKTLSQTLEVLA